MVANYIVDELPRIIENGTKKAESIKNRHLNMPMREREIIQPMGLNGDKISIGERINRFYNADNLVTIENLLHEGYRGRIDLIYIDPPFLTKTSYKGRSKVRYKDTERVVEYFAYDDRWEDGLIDYLKMLYTRLYLMRELLSDKGSIYVHLDYRTVHYVKILMDQIFGRDNFLNEIIWSYKSGGASRRYFSRKHDNILLYSKTKNYIFNPQKEKSYNRDFKPYRFKGVEEYKDEFGWYTLVNARDVWPIDMVGRTSKERVDYDTQKPEKLLERIILSSSNEDSIVADFFAGSGTTGIVAEKLNRRWIMADKGALSKVTTIKRLVENKSLPFSIMSYKEESDKAGRLSIDNVEKVVDNKGQEGLRIELGDYHLNINNIDIRGKSRNTIEKIGKNDSLALIDFIGIDANYDGGIPIIGWQDYRRANKIVIDSQINIFNKGLKGNNIYIKYIDIFGQENGTILHI